MPDPKQPSVEGPIVAAGKPPFNKLLEDMRNNPKNDWQVSDIQTLCSQLNMTAKPPKGGGSHYKVTSPHVPGILTIPARRPIKSVYIRTLVRWADSHLFASSVIVTRPGDRK